MTLAVDVGGTFTDLARWDGRNLRIGKILTSPNQADGVLAGSRALSTETAADALLHGTTVATNAVLEGTGARVVLVTTSGMEDVIEIGRQDRPALYDPMTDRAEPLVPRDLRLSVPAGGLTGSPLEELVVRVTDAAPEAIAVCLLYGFSRAEEEDAIAQALRQALDGVPVSTSSEVAPEFREYERTSTTLLNAYLRPLMGRYLRALWDRIDQQVAEEILVMRSSGGLMGARRAARLPAAALLSGPAAGAIAAAAIGQAHGRRHVISFDMGGTSTDVCRIEDGVPALTYERDVGGHPCRLPSVAIHTVGAGGGSIAWLDPGGALRVGPQSAGASPGPASYGRGGLSPTVTDAHVVLGRIGETAMLGGEVEVQPARAQEALKAISDSLGVTLAETARGALQVADARMERAIRRVSMEEGADPRPAWLVAFGGAGGLHAGSLARRFEMQGVIVPPHAGVLSAVGLLLSPLRADSAKSLEDLQPGIGPIHATASALEREVEDQLAKMGASAQVTRQIVEARYVGQSHETPIAVHGDDDWEDLTDRFHAEHHRRNGFSRPSDPIEVVTVRAEATAGSTARWEEFDWLPSGGDSLKGTRRLLGAQGDEVEASVHDRSRLEPGTALEGPAVIEESEATTFIDRGEHVLVLDDGSLEVTYG